MLFWFVGEGWVKKIILIGVCVDVVIVLWIGFVEDVVDSGVVCDVVFVLVCNVVW